MALRPRLPVLCTRLLLLSTVGVVLGSCRGEPRFVPCTSRVDVAPGETAPPELALPIESLPRGADAAAAVSREHLRLWVETLTQPSLHGRRAGSVDARRTAALLERHFLALGLDPPGGTAEPAYCQPLWSTLPNDQNVLGRLAERTTRKTGSRPLVLIAAHYDALGTNAAGTPFPGADDNASGVAALAELARLAQARSFDLDLVLAAFGGEELSAVGSRFFIERPPIPLGSLSLMLNFDMVGRSTEHVPRGAMGFVAQGPEPSTAALRAELEAAAGESRLRLVELSTEMTSGGRYSDTRAFVATTPTLHLTTGLHPDYHRPSDTAEKIDYEQIAAAVELANALLRRLER